MTRDLSRRQMPSSQPGGLLESLVPGLAVVRTYDTGWLRLDLLAGLVLTAMLVPQGMAYAALAGLPPIVGLYATAVTRLRALRSVAHPRARP
jgi:hypothetical protein